MVTPWDSPTREQPLADKRERFQGVGSEHRNGSMSGSEGRYSNWSTTGHSTDTAPYHWSDI